MKSTLFSLLQSFGKPEESVLNFVPQLDVCFEIAAVVCPPNLLDEPILGLPTVGPEDDFAGYLGFREFADAYARTRGLRVDVNCYQGGHAKAQWIIPVYGKKDFVEKDSVETLLCYGKGWCSSPTTESFADLIGADEADLKFSEMSCGVRSMYIFRVIKLEAPAVIGAVAEALCWMSFNDAASSMFSKGHHLAPFYAFLSKYASFSGLQMPARIINGSATEIHKLAALSGASELRLFCAERIIGLDAQ